ncbi:MAG: AAA family ATPase [Clostridia bacterium]|nr:AAA family ATPase [Clostridia bacterium]
MIIKKIDIENFGKFSGRSFDFTQGFNLVFGNNEDGKTTLMAFIKLMFYGSSSGKSSDVAKNIRRKYTPWNGLPMSGAIEFEQNGEEFRLHKEFKKSASSDKTTVINLSGGEKYTLPGTTDAGQHFFNMDLGEFERSVFVENYGGFSSDASSDSLAMRIANLSASGDESISNTEVLSRIAAAKEELVSKSGKKGLLVDAQTNLEKLKYDLEILNQQISEQQSLQADIDETKKDIETAEKQLESYNLAQKLSRAKKDIAVFSALTEKFDRKEALVQKLKAFSLSASELSDLLQKGKALKSSYEASCFAPNSGDAAAIPDLEFQQLLETEKNIKTLEQDSNYINSQVRTAKDALDSQIESATKKRKIVSFAVLGISVILAATITAILPSFFWIGIILLLSGIGGFGFLRHNLERKILTSVAVQLSKQEYERKFHYISFNYDGLSEKSPDAILEECHAKRDAQMNKILQMLNLYNCSTLDELSQKTVSAQNVKLSSLTNSLNETKTQFVQLISRAKPTESFESANLIFEEIEGLMTEYNQVEHDIVTISQTIVNGKISPEFARSQLDSLTNFVSTTQIDQTSIPESPHELNNMLQEKRRILGELQSKIHLPETDETQLRFRIDEASETANILSDRYKSLALASTALELAVSEMNKGLGSHLSKKTGEYLNAMSGGKYSDVLVSRDLSVETRSSTAEGYHEWKFLSSGTIDRVYLALRLAATDIIAESHNPLPLFLDDILTQYDDKNCQSTIKFLKDYYKNSGSVSQLFFFTCHNHILETAENIIGELNKIIL